MLVPDHPPHVCVCVCTYKRPQLLRRLLEKLTLLETSEGFSYSVVVVDNDQGRSAESTVSEIQSALNFSIRYCPEPRQGIARARNMAVANASGDFVAFIDDDEFPTPQWLVNLFQTLQDYNVDGVLGPVRPHFDANPPRWLAQGGFHERPAHLTGMRLDWTLCRTGNVLLKRELFQGMSEPFRPECLSGEDQDFFRRMIEKGHGFVWCNEAVVYEVVPPARWKRRFLVRRAFQRGVFSLRNHGFPIRRIAQSLVAAPVYAIALPFSLILGQARFMRCVFQFSYHFGRLLAVAGIDLVGPFYVTE